MSPLRGSLLKSINVLQRCHPYGAGTVDELAESYSLLINKYRIYGAETIEVSVFLWL